MLAVVVVVVVAVVVDARVVEAVTRKVLLVSGKRTSCLDTAQRQKQLSKTILWNKGTFFGTPYISDDGSCGGLKRR